ncbi:MAG: hypothetical protein HFJ50_01580 [Clostridia bacterium]|jgi:alpha-tubulin suppressor-like RCC1 family protein|nr:hypothetical protein [Clostridia bacterium]
MICGQLGNGRNDAGKEALLVKTEEKVVDGITKIGAGNKFSCLLDNNGNIYTFGINEKYELGVDNNLEEGGITKSIYAILKSDISDVYDISCGSTHVITYKEDGNSYTWGEGKYGALGNGKNFDNYEPQLVGKNIVQSNISHITIQKGDSVDIDAWTNYFNLYFDKDTNVEFEIVDSELAELDTISGNLTSKLAGRTTVVAREVRKPK